MRRKLTRRPHVRRLGIESLEDRAVPATFGVPWDDPSHLTLSFAPDGTAIAGHTSTLFQTLNAQMPTATWQREILQAFQTWAVQANINIGLVSDGGQPFGAAGSTQHDPRFGDIRVGAQKMSPDSLSISVPDDPALSSTWTGDVLINSSDTFGDRGNSLNLVSVLLHEAGHVFGIGDSTDPNSPMYSNYNGVTKLTSGDIAAMQALYGTRGPDPHEGSNGNDTIGTATTIQTPGSYTGATPLIAYGDISTNKDADVFAVRPPSNYSGPITIRLQSAGLSLLAPQLQVLDGKGHDLGDAQASSDFGDTVTVHLNQSDPNATYYLKVQGATSDVFGIGSYGLAVTFDATSTVSPTTLDTVLRGPYQSLNPNDLNALLLGTANVLLNDDKTSNDDGTTATTITPSPGYARNSHYEVLGSIASPTDTDYYRIQTADSPQGGKPLVLTVTTRSATTNGAAPRVTIIDRNGKQVDAQVLANGDGMYTIQAVGIKAGSFYMLHVGPATAAGSAAVGNYTLDAKFGTAAAQLKTFLNGSISSAASTGSSSSSRLYVAESQLFHFVLSASAVGGIATPGESVRMTVQDRFGRVVYALTATAGDAVSGPALFLTPGAYTVRFSVFGTPGAAVSPLSFQLLGEVISDPIGPVLDDPTLDPALDPFDPSLFAYPIDDTPAFAGDPTLDPGDLLVGPDPSTFDDPATVTLDPGDLLADSSVSYDVAADPGDIVTDIPYWFDTYDPAVLA